MSAAEKKAALERAGSTGRLSKALEGVGEFLAKAGEPWNPKGRSSAPENPKSSPIEPSVTPKGKHVPQNVMGGDAKRPVGEGTTMGGWEKLDEDEETDGQTHGPVGGERIKRAKQKAGKGRVEHDSSTESIEDELDKSFSPGDPRDYNNGDDDDGPAEDDSPADGGDEAEAAGGGAADPRDGDAAVSPGVAQIMLALEQNPELVQALLAAISGGAAGAPAAPGMGGAPALGGAPGMAGAPAPAPAPSPSPLAPPQDQQLARSMAAHRAQLEGAIAADDRAGDLAEAMDAAPVLEALVDFQNLGFAKSLAYLESMAKSLAAISKRVVFLEEGMKKSLTASGAIVEQMLEQAEAVEATKKSLAAVAAQTPGLPMAGVHWAKPAAAKRDRSIEPADKRRLEKSLSAAAAEGNDRAASLLGVIDQSGGLEYIAQRMSDELWTAFNDQQ